MGAVVCQDSMVTVALTTADLVSISTTRPARARRTGAHRRTGWPIAFERLSSLVMSTGRPCSSKIVNGVEGEGEQGWPIDTPGGPGLATEVRGITEGAG